MTNAETLLALKKKIDDAKTRLSELNGQKQTQMATLKEEFKCKSLAEAETKLEKWEEEIQELEIEIENGISSLREEFPELFDELEEE